MNENKKEIEPGTPIIEDKYKIIIQESGPYIVQGITYIKQQFITPNHRGDSWGYTDGATFKADSKQTALCRCGSSKNKPYCDGTHIKSKWNPSLKPQTHALLQDAEVVDGERAILADNEKYCAFARFCDAKGGVWNLIERSDEESVNDAIHDATMCPAGRLKIWDKSNDEHLPVEIYFDPSVVLLEDPKIGVSGPIWIRGGITVETNKGAKYEIRNRVTLCRCGESSNKPFCDGTHAVIKFKDGL